MAQFVIIRGMQNSGKTTTMWFVYQYLLKEADTGSKHLFRWGHETDFSESTIPVSVPQQPVPCKVRDFTAVLTIQGKKVGIVSEGDEPKYLGPTLTILLQYQVDVIICCIRTQDRVGSTCRMLRTEYAPSHQMLKVFRTKRTKSDAWLSVKQTLAVQMGEYVLHILQDENTSKTH